MPQTIETTVYSLRELIDLRDSGEVDAKAVDTALAWVREGQTDHEWYECVYDAWKEKLEAIGFTDIEISFSGFWSQGHGASFKAKADVEQVIKYFANPEGELEKYGDNPSFDISRLIEPAENGCISISIDRTSSHYCHENTCKVNVDTCTPDDWDIAEYNKLIDDLESTIESFRLAISKAIYRDLETEYEYLVSDEACIETADCNEWTFTRSGERF